MGNFTLCEMLKSLPLDSCHPILVAKQDPGSRCFQSADCFWVLPVAKMLWDEVVKKTLIHRHLGVTCLMFRHFMSLSITFCCSFCMENMWNRLHTSSFCDSLTWFGDEQSPFLTSSSRKKIGPWPVGWLWNAVKVCESAQWILKYVLWTTSDATGSTPGFCRICMWMAGKWFIALLLHLMIPENNFVLEISENCRIAARRHTIWLFQWRF